MDEIVEALESYPDLAEENDESLASIRNAATTGNQIVEFWMQERNQQSATWRDHRNINEVMLATALLKAQTGTAHAVERLALQRAQP